MFNYGVSIDPNYPLFYYNIACVYGGKDDLENAISYLQKAEKGNTLARKMRHSESFLACRTILSFIKSQAGTTA
jgi:Tetratricopeptide repeat